MLGLKKKKERYLKMLENDDRFNHQVTDGLKYYISIISL